MGYVSFRSAFYALKKSSLLTTWHILIELRFSSLKLTRLRTCVCAVFPQLCSCQVLSEPRLQAAPNKRPDNLYSRPAVIKVHWGRNILCPKHLIIGELNKVIIARGSWQVALFQKQVGYRTLAKGTGVWIKIAPPSWLPTQLICTWIFICCVPWQG